MFWIENRASWPPPSVIQKFRPSLQTLDSWLFSLEWLMTV